ncbi:hypothetical protein, partial [Vibrio owensii]|uniref:hypothetical protein n=1 Tax=Vibrio owensii TaxID=696485 RepID=UPI0040689D7F
SKLHEYEDINAITDWLTKTLQAERQKREEVVEKMQVNVETALFYSVDDNETKQRFLNALQALTQPNNK